MITFFSNYTAATEIYTLSLHDALPIYEMIVRPASTASRGDFFKREQALGGSLAGDPRRLLVQERDYLPGSRKGVFRQQWRRDRKSTRLNSSHANISYAVFCLKKKKITT